MTRLAPAIERGLRGLLPFAVCLLAGCAGYQLGPTNGEIAGTRSVQINPAENRTLEPRLTEAVTSALRRRLQHDGTYALSTDNSGDIILGSVIKRYDRRSITYQPRDVLTALDFELTLTARVTARDRATGKILFDQDVTGRTTVRMMSDQTTTEMQSLPLLADHFARQAVALLVDGSW